MAMSMVKTGPKGPRNKHKRIFLIEGFPHQLYTTRQETFYSVTWKGQRYQLGKCGEGLAKALRDMNTYAQVNSETRTTSRCVKVEIPGVTLRSVGGNTHVVIMADTKESLEAKEEEVRDLMKSKDIAFEERCEWRCVIDPKHPEPVPESPTEMSVIQCGLLGCRMTYPSDCSACTLSANCRQYAELVTSTQ